MSYTISLVKDGEVVELDEPHTEGGTYKIGGDNKAEMSITWNYSYFWYNEIDEKDGIKALRDDKAKEWIDTLEEAVDNLRDRPIEETNLKGDYWTPTPGNAGHAFKVLLDWAKENPEARFKIV